MVLDRIDWTDHQLDADRIRFSAEQLSEEAEFPTPLGAKELQSFLGLANYFRNHVRFYADIKRPMREVLTKHKEILMHNRIGGAWLLRHAGAKLYFLKDDPDAQIVLRTYLCILLWIRCVFVLDFRKSRVLSCAVYK